MSEAIEIKLQRVVRWSNEVQRTMGEMESEMVALHFAIDELRVEIKSIRAAAPPGVDHPPRAGADLTSPAPAVCFGAPPTTPPGGGAGESFRPWMYYSEEANALYVFTSEKASMVRVADYGVRWRQSVGGAFAGCSIPDAEELLRRAGFERTKTPEMVDRAAERMAASDEDDGA